MEATMTTILVEIRAGEGGADARDLVRRQAVVYAKWGDRRRL
jgi:protein subunit release factor B